MLTLSPAVKLWYCPEPTSMNLGFDGLAARVQALLQADPTSGHLFLFSNRARNRIKILYWGGHGLCLWSQRLEQGRYHFPPVPPAGTSLELTPSQFHMILDGIDLTRVRRFKRFSAVSA